MAALGLAVLCVIFAPEIASAVSVWNSSTAYGHCWLVLPIVAWLVWERRGVLAAWPARPAPWAGLLAVPVVLAWWMADLLGIMEGRQLAAIGLVLVLLLSVLGPRLWWALSVPLLYLVFLVPFGAFLTPALQHFTAGSITAGLRLLDIPFEANDFQITIPEGVFYVAEACAGLRFLIASVAFGVLYAVTMFRSPWRRAAFIAVACVVPILANGVRALGIVLLGHALGSAEAGAADHLIYGWVFFSSIIVLLALAGLPFRQTAAPVVSGVAEPAVERRGGTIGRVVAACVPVLLLAVLCAELAGGRVEADGPPPPAIDVAGCSSLPVSVSGSVTTTLFRCGGQTLSLITTALAEGSNPARVLDAARLPAVHDLGSDIDMQVWRGNGSGAVPWMLARSRESRRVAAYAIEVDGEQGVGGLHDRWRLMRDMLAGGTVPPLARAVTIEADGDEAETALKAFLARLAWRPRQDGVASPARS
jgi:exosortase A